MNEPTTPTEENPIIRMQGFSLSYGAKQALFDVSLDFIRKRTTAIIGPSGCGKSTLLRCLNRMNDFVPNIKNNGSITFNNHNVLKMEAIEIRTRIGMVFQKPNPFPKSIANNITWGPRIHGIQTDYDELVENSLKRVALWEEVKDRLHDSALDLSGGQQQRLCIARTIAMKPEVILMDEPCSALDPKATLRIEGLIQELSKDYTIIIVTHNMQQANRASDYTAFLYNGRLIEYNTTYNIFNQPKEKKTLQYITGRFG